MSLAVPFAADPLHRQPASASSLQDGGSIAGPRAGAEVRVLLCAETIWAERRNSEFLLSKSQKHLGDPLAPSQF